MHSYLEVTGCVAAILEERGLLVKIELNKEKRWSFSEELSKREGEESFGEDNKTIWVFR